MNGYVRFGSKLEDPAGWSVGAGALSATLWLSPPRKSTFFAKGAVTVVSAGDTRGGRSVVSRPPGEDPEVVVPGGDDAAEAGDREEDTGEGVARLGAVAAESGPLAGGIEGEGGEREQQHADADADGGGDHARHMGTPLGHGFVSIDSAEVVPLGAVRLVLDPGLVLPADAAVGLLVAVHAGAWLSAKT